MPSDPLRSYLHLYIFTNPPETETNAEQSTVSTRSTATCGMDGIIIINRNYWLLPLMSEI